VNTYRAYGLHIASDVPLPLPPGSGAPDLSLRLDAPREVPHSRPPGVRLAEVGRPNGTIFYTLSRSASGTTLRYPGLCDFVGDETFSSLSVHPDPGADEALLPVLIAGAVIAIHLMLRPSLVLHASAVRAGDAAVAFVGSSGMGKSTLAAGLCELGCELVSDDLLRVDRAGDRVVTYPGGTENRLRPSARDLALAAPADAVHETADGRLALRQRTITTGVLSLAACVVPHPSREVTSVHAVRLRPSAALLRLSHYPRVLGWTDPSSTAHTFQALADLAEQVPVYEAAIPWGPPFADGVLESLLAAVLP